MSEEAAGRNPFRAGAEAAAEKLGRAEVGFSAYEYVDSEPVRGALETLSGMMEFREPEATHRVVVELAAEVVAFGSIIRAGRGEQPLTAEFIEEIKRIIEKIMNDIFEP
ncbi:hypothetical protein [Arthrobacter mobilis]|uniref:Uncharacterized protein n=1 Tax=Arthrobacter mobilis TaxID=2724944 RepID=A0A7X6HDS4_9MICC|nr:hypothetical protein [Arthrobacter mobilis]NKX54389.1 hypothetical protein [Arthrobacter mobilis]